MADTYSQRYQSVSSGTIVSVTSSSFRLTTTESAAPLWMALLISCVVWTGCPLMAMMTSWSIMPALWSKHCHKSLTHKALLKQTQPCWVDLTPWGKHLWPLDKSVPASGSFPLKRQSKQWKRWGHGFIMHRNAWHLHLRHLLLLMILCGRIDNTCKTAG